MKLSKETGLYRPELQRPMFYNTQTEVNLIMDYLKSEMENIIGVWKPAE